jgi:hypothetical protein
MELNYKKKIFPKIYFPKKVIKSGREVFFLILFFGSL